MKVLNTGSSQQSCIFQQQHIFALWTPTTFIASMNVLHSCLYFQASCTLSQQNLAGTRQLPAGLTGGRSNQRKLTWPFYSRSTCRPAWIFSDQGRHSSSAAPFHTLYDVLTAMSSLTQDVPVWHNAGQGQNKQRLTQKNWMQSCIVLYRSTRLLQHLHHLGYWSRQQKQEAEEE